LLFSLPLIYLGWMSAAPNLNLVNGCLVYLCAVMLFVIGFLTGSNIFKYLALIAFVAWLACSIEMALRVTMKWKGYLGEE